jgi:hypothetical protein
MIRGRKQRFRKAYDVCSSIIYYHLVSICSDRWFNPYCDTGCGPLLRFSYINYRLSGKAAWSTVNGCSWSKAKTWINT